MSEINDTTRSPHQTPHHAQSGQGQEKVAEATAKTTPVDSSTPQNPPRRGDTVSLSTSSTLDDRLTYGPGAAVRATLEPSDRQAPDGSPSQTDSSSKLSTKGQDMAGEKHDFRDEIETGNRGTHINALGENASGQGEPRGDESPGGKIDVFV